MEQLKNKIKLATGTLEEKIEEYVINFNECFGTSININKTEYPILMKEFDDLLENYKMSKLYKTILHEIVNLQEEIHKTLNDDERLIIEKLQYLLDKLYIEQAEETFIAGYCLKIEMEKESKNKNYKELSQEDFRILIETFFNKKISDKNLELIKDSEMYKALFK